MFKWIGGFDLQPSSTLRVEYCRYDLNTSGAVVKPFANHASFGAVRQETTEEQLDVWIVRSRV